MLQWLATVIAVYITFRLVFAIWTTFLRPGKNLKRYGAWAVVTGATDGIGKAMAIELARKGLNVVVIARDEAKLKAVVSEITTEQKVQATSVTVDFSNFDTAAQQRVSQVLSSLDVGVLVNNVGQSYPFPQYFDQLSDELVASLVDLNVQSTTRMIRIVLPQMTQKGRGAIVNISSAASQFAAPLLSEYGAAKSYVNALSVGLHHEFKAKGIDVQLQLPFFVATKLAKIRNASLTVASPRGYAKVAVRAIGYEAVTSPFWSHALQLWLISLVPASMFAKYVLNLHKGIRGKALSKDKRSS